MFGGVKLFTAHLCLFGLAPYVKGEECAVPIVTKVRFDLDMLNAEDKVKMVLDSVP